MIASNDVERIVIEPFSPPNLDAIMEIEVDSFPLPWTRKSYEEVIPMNNVRTWVAKIDEEIVGYMLTQFVADEMELHTLAVKPAFRRIGIGSKLVENMIFDAGILGVKYIYLLVRPTNRSALTLYQKFGFQEVGIRARYYQDNAEDALVMRIVINE